MTAALSLAPLAGPSRTPTVPAQKVVQATMTCLNTGEQVSGLNKLCYYDCLDALAVVAIASTELCPRALDR